MGGAVELGFRTEIGFAGIEVDGHRDVLVDDEPPAPGLFVHIGHPHREIELLALLIGAGDVLDAVAIGEIAVGGDVEISQLDGDGPSKLSRNVCQSLR